MFLKIEKPNPKVREAYKAAFSFCQNCLKSDLPLDVHHIFPARAQMKIDHFLNFLTLCRACHIEIEALNYSERVLAGLDLKRAY